MGGESRGWQGAVLKALGAPDHELTVVDRTEMSPNYMRLRFDDGQLLAGRDIHPTMWIRLWFNNGRRLHQRAYTILHPDPAAGVFDLEFSLHDGPGPNWARSARPGDTITATVMGSKFAIPEPPPAGYIIVGDIASLPAIKTLLEAVEGTDAARVWLEYQHDSDRELSISVGAKAAITWVPREDAGRGLVRQVEREAFDAADHFGWIACDMKTTRAVAGVLRGRYKIDRKRMKSQAYWLA